MTEPRPGLTAAEVDERVRAGRTNRTPDRTSRSYRGIIRSNILTRFNLIISILGTVVLVVGELGDALFVIVMIVNAAVGIVQEVRAKHTLDRLRVLVVPMVTVRREGREIRLAPDDVVIDDLLVLGPGDHVPIDGLIIGDGSLEVDESALTGEADPVVKTTDDEVLSGSAVVAGSALVTATRVGTDAWIHRLVMQAKEYAPATSELRSGVDQILRLVGWVIVPLAAMLLWSQLRADQSTDEALISSVAGVVGLVPQGLVLLVSMALAVAVIRLAREHVVVQELHAVEGLARIDVFCVDKTGTLTTGVMQLETITHLDHDAPAVETAVETALASLGAADRNSTATLRVIAEHVDSAVIWTPDHLVPFSSARKWSGATFEPPSTAHADRSWVLGAPEILLERTASAHHARIDGIIEAAANRSGRVVLLASTGAPIVETSLPTSLTPRAVIVLSEELRPDVAETLEFFRRQGVQVKVISGDSPMTVAAVAGRLGLPRADHHLDMRGVDTSDAAALSDLVEETSVFGRVVPEQKRAIVDALQRSGHTVAMTGDGVNDIPALKRADIGVAVDTATPATKAISQLVLLDGRFDRMPHVVAEGRRVIANMERVSALFVTKTVYAAIFALTFSLSGSVFPFLPRQMSLVSELTIGLPAFVLSFRAADAASRPGYLRRVLRFALPAGAAAAAVTVATFWAARSPLGASSVAEARTVSTVALVIFAFWVLYVLMYPIDRLDLGLLAALAAMFVATLSIPPLRDFYRLDRPPFAGVMTTSMILVSGVAIAELVLQMLRRRRR